MARIFLLTAPFDEDAKTGDGQYAASLEQGFKEHYQHVSCKWLKQSEGKYSIPLPLGATSIPSTTIPSAIVLQPVANGNTVLSGYKLNTELTDSTPANSVNLKTVSPRTPKVLLKNDGQLHTFTIMDIYSQKPVQLDIIKVKSIISSLKGKNEKILAAIKKNTDELGEKKKQKAKKGFLILAYNSNHDEIQSHCSLNEYIEAHLDKKQFDKRLKDSLDLFEKLEDEFSKNPARFKKLEKLSDKLTGIKGFTYDFKSNNLSYDIENDKKFTNLYDYDGLKNSVDLAIKKLSLIEYFYNEYPSSFKALVESTNIHEKNQKQKFIQLLFNDGFKSSTDEDKAIFVLNDTTCELDKTTFMHVLSSLNEDSLKACKNGEIQNVTKEYLDISKKLLNSSAILTNTDNIRSKISSALQGVVRQSTEPYLTANQDLGTFFSKRKLSNSEGFHMAFDANKRDSLKPQVIANIINSMRPIDKDTYLDIHIRPPDCGVFITPQDIKQFQQAGIKVNLTIHEYKQNYTRRHLQQYTHELLREADFVQFFNQLDRDNAIIASEYGDCDKRNTKEKSGVLKKIREVGKDVELDKYPVEMYDLRSKSGLTVASQKLSDEPSHPKDVLARAPNILSFGTIRPGKGFEEALKLAQLIKKDRFDIESKMKKIPVVKLAGDPQDAGLMQKMINERFREEDVSLYQKEHPYNTEFTNSQRRDYWKKLVKDLNAKVKSLANPFIEIYPWCEPNELLALKQECKYVCRMDDMGMRNNGSAIISVLDVGIVYTKFGSVTDPIFEPNGKYGQAVDIGKYRYGQYSLILKEERLRKALKPNQKLKPLLSGSPDSIYKRLPESRDPQDILDSIVDREMNQIKHSDNISKSQNFQTVYKAQKLLTEHFTLQNSAKNLLENIKRSDLTVSPELEDDLFDLNPVETIKANLQNSPEINFGECYEPYRPSLLSLFAKPCGVEYSLKSKQRSTNMNSNDKKCLLL